jgi:hypothetical protein
VVRGHLRGHRRAGLLGALDRFDRLARREVLEVDAGALVGGQRRVAGIPSVSESTTGSVLAIARTPQ